MASFGGGRRGTPHGDTSNPADDELAAAVARLPAAQREVVSLKIDGGLTFAQIAAVLGTNINTAAGRYRAALDKLRAAVTPPEATR